ncbi:MAG: hypothetical protein ABIB47_05550 [Candidatus Woesearchaeota archaeon]
MPDSSIVVKSLASNFSTFINSDLIPRLKLIVTTPFTQPDLLWLVIPLIFVLFAIQLYFGRNRTEQLGWNTAFGNSVSLFWVIVLLLRFTLEDTPLSELLGGRAYKELILIVILAVWTIILLSFDYYHIIPRKLAFLLSSSIPINTIAFLFIVIILGDVPFDSTTAVAGVVLLLLVALFFKTLRSVIKPSPSAEKTLEVHKLKRKGLRELRKERIKRKFQRVKERIKEGTIKLKEKFSPRKL